MARAKVRCDDFQLNRKLPNVK